jgi:hypothetical protein
LREMTMDNPGHWSYTEYEIKRKEDFPMFKKFTSLLLSLLLCLSILPAQVLAVDLPENDPPVVVEPVDPEEPNDLGTAVPQSTPPVPNDDEAPHKY